MTDADIRSLSDEARRLFQQSPRTLDVLDEIRNRQDEIRAEHGKAVARWWGEAAGVNIRPISHPSGVRQPEPGNPFWEYPQEAAE